LVSTVVDEVVKSGPLMNLVIANGRFFAGGLCVSPDSDLSDGFLNIVDIGNVGTLDYMKNVPKLRNGQKISHAEVLYKTAKTISVSSAQPMPVDFDGELAGYTPLNVSIKPNSLRFIA
jgi:diacylglycerol kinase (ATP)